MLALLNWFGNAAMLVAFLSVVAVAVHGPAGETMPPAGLQPVDELVQRPRKPPFGRPGPSVRAYSPPRPRSVSVRSGSRSYSSSSRRSFGGGGFRSGK